MLFRSPFHGTDTSLFVIITRTAVIDTAGMYAAEAMTPEEQIAGRDQSARGVNRIAPALPSSLSNSAQRPTAAINFPVSQTMINRNIMARAAQIMAASNAASLHQHGLFNHSMAATRGGASNQAVNFERGHALASAGRNELPFWAPRSSVGSPALSVSPDDVGDSVGAKQGQEEGAQSVQDVDTNSSPVAPTPETNQCFVAKRLEIPPPSAVLPSMEQMQLTDIWVESIDDNDVLCGRGGATNSHIGNEKFRDLVAAQKVEYMRAPKRDKPMVSRGIVRAVRNQKPPGRFLAKDEVGGLWFDIGDQKAQEKTSQALREGAPRIRRVIADDMDDTDDDRQQTTQNAFLASSENPGMFPPTTGFHQGLFRAPPNAMVNSALIQGAMAASWAAQQRVVQVNPTASLNPSMLPLQHLTKCAPFNAVRPAFPQQAVSVYPSRVNFSFAYSDLTLVGCSGPLAWGRAW